MIKTEEIMGMPITVEIRDTRLESKDLDEVFEYFRTIDERFSTYKQTSEISRINRGDLQEGSYSADMRKVLRLCEQTFNETNGYFDIHRNGKIDPSGIVKGWSIWQASHILRKKGYTDFYIDAGGDIQAEGHNWIVGIQNPFNEKEIIKRLSIQNKGVATSGTASRGQHIYNPFNNKPITDIVSLTVIGPNIYEADRFATPAFAMGKKGIQFIESLVGFEGYMIDIKGIATFTSSFEKYVL